MIKYLGRPRVWARIEAIERRYHSWGEPPLEPIYVAE